MVNGKLFNMMTINMKNLLENWNVFITEALGNYEVEVVLRAEKDTQVKDDIFEKIRAIEGVTVIKTTQTTRKDETGNKVLHLLIRFMVNPTFGAAYLEKIKNKIRSLKDDQGDRILSIKVLHLPREVDPS